MSPPISMEEMIKGIICDSVLCPSGAGKQVCGYISMHVCGRACMCTHGEKYIQFTVEADLNTVRVSSF